MNWQAQIWVARQDGMTHVYCKTIGDNADDALAGAQTIFEIFPREKIRFVRALPCASSDFDFDTKETKYAGFTRFSYSDEDGPTRMVEDSLQIPLGEI